MKKNFTALQDEEYRLDYETDDVQETDESTLEVNADESILDSFSFTSIYDDVETTLIVGGCDKQVSITLSSEDNEVNLCEHARPLLAVLFDTMNIVKSA